MPLLEIWNQEPWVRFGVAISLALIFAVIIRRAGWGLCCRVHEGTIAFIRPIIRKACRACGRRWRSRLCRGQWPIPRLWIVMQVASIVA